MFNMFDQTCKYSDEQGKYGEKVAFMKIAAQKLNEAQKLLKNQPQQMQDVVQFITDVVTQKLDSAKRDNDFIYHEAEPASSALPEIKGASLVKPIPFQPYDPSMGKDIFEKLIPMKAHESSSLYSEEKANLLRRYASIVSEKDKELSSWLAAMHIDDLLRPEDADNIPVDLTTKCESLQSNPGAIKKSTEMLTKLKDKGGELEKALEETKKEITDVQNEKNIFMGKYGVKLDEDKLKEFLEEVDNYQQKHVDAKKTNDELEKAFETHRSNLELMIGPKQALHGILPSQNILDSPIEDDAVQRIRDLLAKIEKMKTQRVQFMDKLREEVNKDDITHLIATRDGADLESLFKEELKKHDESCELLQCNLDAQEKIMKALTEANAKYAHARRSVAEIKAKRDVVVKSLIASYDFFMNFKEKVSSGVTFYNQMSEIFETRRKEIAAICKGEKERLQKIVEKAKQIKEERERKPESKVDPTLSGAIPPERRNNPGNPQQPPGAQAGYQSQPGHLLHHPGAPLLHQAIPHSLRGPAPNQPPPMQSEHPGQFPPGSLSQHQPRGPNNQPVMPQYIPRIPSATLLTSRPRMSYPHPPFTTTSPEGQRSPTSVPWQPPARPSDTLPTANSNIRFPPQHGVRPPNVPQGPSMHSSIPLNQQRYPGRPLLPMQTPQGQGFQHGNVGSDRGNWQPGGQQYGKGQQFGSCGSGQNKLQPQMLPQRHVIPQQPIISHQPTPSAQPSLQQRPQLLPPVQQHLPQQPTRPDTPPSPQRIQPPYQSKPPSYQQQFEIGSNQLAQLQQPQHMQPGPQQQPGPFRNTIPPGQQSHGPRIGQYQQPGQQHNPMANQQSRSRQISTPYQQQPPIRFPAPNQVQASQQPLQHQLPPGHHQVPPQNQLPQQAPHKPPTHNQPPRLTPQQQSGAIPQQPSGPYHQHGPYQQQVPYESHQQLVASHHQTVQPGYQDQRGPPGPPPQQLVPNQHPRPQVPPVQKQPPTYQQLTQPQFPNNLPPALEPQSYQNQPLARKHSSESVPSRVPYQPSQAREINPHDPSTYSKPLQPALQGNIPFQTSQHERPANPQTQLPYSGPLQPIQSKNTDKVPSNPTQEGHGHFQQSYHNKAQTSESQYPSQSQAPSSQHASQTVDQSKSSYVNQQWPQEQKYRPSQPQQQTYTQHPQINKAIYDPNMSKPRECPSTPSSTSSHNAIRTQQENQSSQQGELPPNFSKAGVYPSSSASSQGVPTRPSVTSTYLPTSSHNFTETQQENQPDRHPSSTQNSNPPLDRKSPYFPALSSQTSQPYSNESQPNDNVAKGAVSSSILNLRSKSFQDFNPTKVVLAKPGALSVSPTPASTASNQDIVSVAEEPSQAELSDGEGNHKDTSISSHADLPGGTSAISITKTAHLNIAKPPSTIDDKLLENLKSLDSPQAPRQAEKLTEAESTGPQISGQNISESGSSNSSNQEDVHKLQQKVLLQQQQLIEQQQRFLEQQTLGEHSQVWKLMEQIKQQQKELDELRNEMKVKDQFGEIERHLETLERRQNAAEVSKTSEPKSDEMLGETNEPTESAGVTEEMFDKTKEGDITKEDKKTLEMGEKLLENTTHDQLSEITSKVEGNVEEVKEDFLMSQLNQFSSTSSNVTPGSNQDPTSSSVSEQSCEDKTISYDPPPKPSRTPQAKPDITTKEKYESSSSTGSVLTSETDIPIHTKAVELAINNEAPPPKPVKQRPPPPPPEVHPQTPEVHPQTPEVHPQTPEVHPQTRPIVSHVTPDVFTKLTADTDEDDSSKQSERNDERDYVVRLAREVVDFRAVVNDLTKRQARGPSILTKEWLAVQHYQDTMSQVLTSDVAKKNTTKNRYLDILPYDQTRVILEDKEDSDYINATMIEDLTPLSPKYIASQGPIPQCFMDFWLMIWQQKCPLIVMLTNEVEGKKLKCHQYWPKDEGHSMLFGSLRVTMKRQTSLAFWKERLVHITHNETHELHVLEHYQFTGWPDHGVPNNPSDFFTFMGHIYIRHQTIDPDIKQPILLHCSAGVGRTGAFIVIYSAMREMYSGNGIMEVQKLVKKLREKRKYMVQKKEQYEFCYRAILHCAEQFLIIENSGNSAEGYSSDSISSSDDTCSSLSSDDETYQTPVIPERPKISQNQREILASDAKQAGKKDHYDYLDSEHTPQSPTQSDSKCIQDSVISDSSSQKCEAISKESDCTSQKYDKNAEIVQNVERNSGKVEGGNNLNNFLEICTKSLLLDDILPVTREEEINKEGMVAGDGLQDINMKDSTAKGSGNESSSSKGSNMGDTKYKEITEEPEEQVAESRNTDCENMECKTTNSENTTVIPGLQEIQEGLIKDDDDVITEPKSVGLGSDIRVDMLATETTSNLESKDETILPQQEIGARNVLDVPEKNTDVRGGENDEVKLPSTDMEVAKETENQ